MSEYQVTGTVIKIYDNAKNWKIRVQTTDGSADFTTFDNPHNTLGEGGDIKFTAVSREVNGNTYWNIKKGTLTGTKPAAPAAPAGKPGGGGGGRNYAETQKAITFQHAQKEAVNLVGLALQQGALTLPKKQGDQYDAIVTYFNEAARDIYTDVQTFLKGDPEELETPEAEKPEEPEVPAEPASPFA